MSSICSGKRYLFISLIGLLWTGTWLKQQKLDSTVHYIIFILERLNGSKRTALISYQPFYTYDAVNNLIKLHFFLIEEVGYQKQLFKRFGHWSALSYRRVWYHSLSLLNFGQLEEL